MGQQQNPIEMMMKLKALGQGGGRTPSPMGDPMQAMQGDDFPMILDQIRQGNMVNMSPDMLSRLGLMGARG